MHKPTWSALPNGLTRKKAFDYYPRGRIEIRNGICRIYLNQNINKEHVVGYLINEFELDGFDEIEVINDHSSHYESNIEKQERINDESNS